MMWTIQKFHDRIFVTSIGPYADYNDAHHHAAELRRYHGRNGWSYAVARESSRDQVPQPANVRGQAPKLLPVNS